MTSSLPSCSSVHGPIVLLTGSSNLALAEAVAAELGVKCHVCAKPKFSNGETNVTIPISIRDADVYVLQTTIGLSPNDACMELFIILQAAKLSSPSRLTAVVPGFGYARQDRKSKPHEPISAKLMADIVCKACGADRFLTIDLHADQIQGFFDVPVDNLSATNLFVRYIAERFNISTETKDQSDDNKQKKDRIVIVSPDAGGVKRVRDFANKLGGVNIALIDKNRPRPNEVDEMMLVGSVAGRTAIIVDDMVDTGGTLMAAANLLKKQGAIRVIACATHGILSGKAFELLKAVNDFELLVTDTADVETAMRQKTGALVLPCIKLVSVAQLIAVAIHKSNCGESLSELFFLDKLNEQVPKRMITSYE